MRLGEIRGLLDIKDHGDCPCGHTQELVAKRVGELDAEIRQMRGQLTDLLSVAQSSQDPEVWACEPELMKKEGEK